MTPTRTPFRSSLRSSAALAVAALVLAGCGSADGDGTSSGTDESSTKPVTIENCGEKITFDQAPERAVGYYQHPTELMVALGLQDKIAGMAYPDNDPLPQYQEAYEKVPLISKEDASFEQVLKREPDFVYGGYSSSFDEEAGRSRKAFEDAGIKTYLSSESCQDDDSESDPVTIDQVYEEIETVGKIFRVEDRADELVDELRTQIEDTREQLGDVEPAKVFVYDSGDKAPYTSGGTGISNQVIEQAGGTNVFADVDKDWTEVSWEQVVKAQPDVIVIYDYYGTPSIEKKKQLLLSRPELKDVPAIKNERFGTLTLQDAVLGVRAPYAVTSLAKQLHPDLVQ